MVLKSAIVRVSIRTSQQRKLDMTTETKTKEKARIIRVQSWKVEVPAGTYYLGDPCYSIQNNDTWSKVCDGWFNGNEYGQPLAEIGDSFVLGFNTRHGDGVYYDQNGAEYGVDSGTIGLVPIELADCDPGRLCQKVTFKHRTICTRDDEGTLEFGKYRIVTG